MGDIAFLRLMGVGIAPRLTPARLAIEVIEIGHGNEMAYRLLPTPFYSLLKSPAYAPPPCRSKHRQFIYQTAAEMAFALSKKHLPAIEMRIER